MHLANYQTKADIACLEIPTDPAGLQLRSFERPHNGCHRVTEPDGTLKMMSKMKIDPGACSDVSCLQVAEKLNADGVPCSLMTGTASDCKRNTKIFYEWHHGQCHLWP